jgi:stage IV sporulation protein FB
MAMAEHRHHFKIAGIPVRVEPVFFVIMALFGLQLAEERVGLVFLWIGVAFVSILVHELGHGLTLKAFGVPSEITLQGMGGVTVHRRRLSRTRNVMVSVAGSFAALIVLWFPMRTVNGSEWILHQSYWVRNGVLFAAYVNFWWSVANLLPIRPLDGGNVVTELFGVRAARRISLVAAAAGGLFAITHDQPYAGFFALFLALGSYQEIAAEKGSAPPPPPDLFGRR